MQRRALQTARLKAAPGSGWGRWLVRLQLEIGVSLLLGQARPASVRLAATQTERTPAFPPLQWHAQQRGQLRLRNSRLSSAGSRTSARAPVLPGTRGRCGTPGLHQTRSRSGRYTVGSEAHRLHRPEGRGQTQLPGSVHPVYPASRGTQLLQDLIQGRGICLGRGISYQIEGRTCCKDCRRLRSRKPNTSTAARQRDSRPKRPRAPCGDGGVFGCN